MIHVYKSNPQVTNNCRRRRVFQILAQSPGDRSFSQNRSVTGLSPPDDWTTSVQAPD